MIIITRPEKAGKALQEELKQHNIASCHFPLITIAAGRDHNVIIDKLAALPHNGLVLLLSQHAVEMIPEDYLPHPDHTFFAIGKTTANLFMQRFHTKVSYPPLPETSELLLNLPELIAVKDRPVLLLKGLGGRKLLLKTLKARGAKVDYCECYQRVFTQINSADLTSSWKIDKKNIIVATSNVLLQRLYDVVPEDEKKALLQCQLIVVSERMATFATHLGWDAITLSPSAQNKSLVETIRYLLKKEALSP